MTLTTARLIYPHQLFEDVFAAPINTLLILIEDDLFFRQFPFHKQKLVLHRASMQAFKDALEDKGYTVSYVQSSSENASMQQLADTLKAHTVTDVEHYELVDDWLEKRLSKTLDGYEVSRFNSPGFLTTRGQIDDFFENNPNRMQQFYEWQRKRLNILMDGKKPTGGKWSFDESNRKKLPKNIELPKAYPSVSSKYVSEATTWVETNFKENPGSSESFQYPITHDGATAQLKDFVKNRLEKFGPYEDAIDSRQSELFHSVLSPLLNTGLLTPQQVLDAVKDLDTVPIESLEGFIRQIIGWREYMRATYVRFGSEMRTSNHLQFKKKLPKSWWNATVGIEPIDIVIRRVLDTGYAHHIERLMVLGNSMVLLRVDPDDAYEWFMSLFIDAYDWVMVPNVYAMSQFAAGDLITTKPYISGSNYVIKMSDYKKGDWSEVWDSLYWQFVDDHRTLLENNYRSAMMVKLYDRFDDEKKQRLASVAEEWLS
jgi:deoxyribodipyrimidine photolyase-related protein